jgi:hypothetical protein
MNNDLKAILSLIAFGILIVAGLASYIWAKTHQRKLTVIDKSIYRHQKKKDNKKGKSA